jgi:hypothetical protein
LAAWPIGTEDRGKNAEVTQAEIIAACKYNGTSEIL